MGNNLAVVNGVLFAPRERNFTPPDAGNIPMTLG